MELRRRHNFRRILTVVYVLAFAVYIIVGLQPAEATHYNISGNLTIPSIGLSSDITTLELSDHRLNTPDTIVGSYNKYANRTLLIGHSSTVFNNLHNVAVDDYIVYNNADYLVTDIKTLPKDKINMDLLLMPLKDESVVIMTCAGESIGEKDATHRLIVTAIRA